MYLYLLIPPGKTLKISSYPPADMSDNAYYLANRERMIANAKARYQAKRDEIIKKARASYKENREKHLAYQTEYYKKRKELDPFYKKYIPKPKKPRIRKQKPENPVKKPKLQPEPRKNKYDFPEASFEISFA